MEDLKSRLQKFLRDFDQLTSHKKPSILFATKYLNKEQFASFIEIALDLKITPLLIGENRIQDGEEKVKYLLSLAPHLRSKFTFVMIGNLQKNKINKALTIFDEIHSVDSIELAKYLNEKYTKFCGEPRLLSTPTGI